MLVEPTANGYRPANERSSIKRCQFSSPLAIDMLLTRTTAWPASLRVKPVEGALGIFEMTWSFKGPDGRATFEWIQIDGTLGVRWRLIGDHSIFKRP